MEREKGPQGCKGGRGGRDQNLREKHRIFGRTMKGKMEILSDRKGEKKSPVLKAKTAPFWGALLTAPPCKQHFGAKPRVSGPLPLPTSPSEPPTPHFVFKTPQLASNPPQHHLPPPILRF